MIIHNGIDIILCIIIEKFENSKIKNKGETRTDTRGRTRVHFCSVSVRGDALERHCLTHARAALTLSLLKNCLVLLPHARAKTRARTRKTATALPSHLLIHLSSIFTSPIEKEKGKERKEK